MTRYVDHPHGITIGSDNVFFYRDEEDEMQEYPCILWPRRYHFDEINCVNVSVRSHAQQLIWNEIVEREPVEYKGEIIGHSDKVRHELTRWARNWCENNAPGWGVAPSRTNEPNPSIFFAKRKHAVAFSREIQRMLKGMTFA